MDLKNLVIHQLEKKQGKRAVLKKAQRELKITDVHQTFMSEVRSVYYNKSNPIYGVFDSEKESYPFQKFLDSFLQKKSSFFEFTEMAIAHFEKIINEISQATGGYVLFALFESTETFVVTIVLNDKESYMINDNLDISANARLDIEKLDVANFTNCTKWNNGSDIYCHLQEDRKIFQIISRNLLVCTDYTSAKESSENFKKALTDYLVKSGCDKKQIEETKATVFSYCEQRIKTKEDINLDFVARLVNHDRPELFIEFASSEVYQVSSSFKGHNATLRSLKFYSYKSRELTIVFDSKLLNDTIILTIKKIS